MRCVRVRVTLVELHLLLALWPPSQCDVKSDECCVQLCGSLFGSRIGSFAVVAQVHHCDVVRDKSLSFCSPFHVLKVFQVVLRFCSCVPTNMRSLTFTCCVALCRSQWPIPFVLGPDTVPNVEVSLDAPAQPLPDVSGEIGRLEADREAKQGINTNKMIRAFNKELGSARARIAALVDASVHQTGNSMTTSHDVKALHSVGSSTSFLKSQSVRVVVAPENPSPDSARSAVAGIEHARMSSEDAWSEAAIAEMSRLTDIVVATAESEISAVLKSSASLNAPSKHVGFIQLGEGSHDVADNAVANVQVVASGVPYPTVQSLVDSLEGRRDISEGFEKAQALSMYMKLLKFENMLVESALSTLVANLRGGR